MSENPTTLRSLCEELVEELEGWMEHSNCLPESKLLTKARAFLQRNGCWLDDGAVDPALLPDACVIDEGAPHNCIYASELVRQGKGKLDCKYWNTGEPTP